MLSKRVLVIAQDRQLQKRLVAGAMAAGAAVQSFAAADEAPARVDAELVLYALGWSLDDPQLASLLARLPDGASLVPVLPAPQLDAMVRLLNDPRVPCALSAEDLTANRVSQTLAKLLYGDLMGLDKVMPWGVRTYSMLVGDYHEKAQAIGTISDFATALGVRRKFREQIDQCIDEMLMNALYDAPVDAEGRPLFAEVPVKERIDLKVPERAIVQYACDGDRFAVSVRDSFGSLRKETVLAYLAKCLHADGIDQIDRKAGGAGLGLYLICNAASEVHFHIFEGRATEVVCTFDLLQPRTQLRALGVFEESIATADRHPLPTAGGARVHRRGRRREDHLPTPPPRPPGGTLLLPGLLTFAVLLLVTAVTLVALPYIKRPAQATVKVESDPPGATIYVDGRRRGQAPVAVEGLEAGRSYAFRAALAGHRDDEQLVTPARGTSTVRLATPRVPGQVSVESEPPGARLFVDGIDSGKTTPATVEVEAGRGAEVVLRKDGFLEQRLAVTGPAAGERTVYRARLPLSPDVASLRIEVEPEGAAVTVDGLALLPPGRSYQTFVQPGVPHKIVVRAAGHVEHRETRTLAAGKSEELQVKLTAGGSLALETNVAATVLVDGKSTAQTPLPAPLVLPEGKHQVRLRARQPYLDYATSVEIAREKPAELKVDFGTVSVTAPNVAVRPAGSDVEVTELSLPAGAQKVTLVHKESGEEREKRVEVAAGGRTVVDAW